MSLSEVIDDEAEVSRANRVIRLVGRIQHGDEEEAPRGYSPKAKDAISEFHRMPSADS